MPPKKGGGSKKGKMPAKKRVVPQVSPPQSSSDDESWNMLQELQAKLSVLEAQKRAKQSAVQKEDTPRRSDRETKGRRKREMRALTQDLMKRFNALESMQGLEGEGQIADKVSPVSERTAGRQKRRRAEAGETHVATVEASADTEGEEEQCPPWESDAPGTSTAVYGECATPHTTQCRSATWPWAGGMQHTHAGTNCSSPPAMGWPSYYWPPINTHCAGWGWHCNTPNSAGTSGEGKSCEVTQHPSVPNTGYNTVPFAAMPYTDYNTPLGDHLTAAVKEKIWKNEYVDFYDLLNREFEIKEIDKGDEKLKEKYRRKRPERNWTNWVTGFTIYAGVLVKMQPWRASALFQYFDTICRAKSEFEGQAWLRYDKAFRMRSAIRPELRWDEPHQGLWLQHMTPARAYVGDRFDSGHLNKKSNGNTTTRTGAGQGVQPRLPCYEYNNRGFCSRYPCRFRHDCITCGGKHPNNSCFRTGAQRQNKAGGLNKRPEGGSGPSGKGAHTN